MTEKYDLIVIGGGPGGYTSAIAAAKNKKHTALFEKSRLGGTCLNVGCIPTKFLLDKAAMMDKIRQMTKQEIFRDAGSFSYKKIQGKKNVVIDRLTDGVKHLLKKNGVDYFDKMAELKADGRVLAGGNEYQAENIIIATGSEPARLSIPGADLALDSTEALQLEKVFERMIVIGGGVIGLELASAFASFGSQITVIEVMKELFPGEERMTINRLKNELKARGMEIILGSQVQSIERSGDALNVAYINKNKSDTVMTDQVLMAVGREPRLMGIDADALGLKLTDKGFISVDQHMRTNLHHVYAVGDVAGGYQLAHAAFAEAETAVANICGKKQKMNGKAVPRCVYTIPPFAAVGITSKKAEEQGVECITGSFVYEGNGMALAEGASGIVYLLMEKSTEKTLGVQIVGEGAPEMIALATAAVEKGYKFKDWRNLVIAHPSLCEMLKESAMDCFGKAIHK